MSMGKNEAPPAPDYAAAARAQGGANLQATIAGNIMNRPNEVTPYGSRTWQTTGNFTVPAAEGNPEVTVPTWQSNVSLTPLGQQRFDQEQRITGQLGNLAEYGLNRVGGSVAQPFNTQGLPNVASIPGMMPQGGGGVPWGQLAGGGGYDPRTQFNASGQARTAATQGVQAAATPAAATTQPAVQQATPDTSDLGRLATAFRAAKPASAGSWLASQTGDNSAAMTSMFNAQKASNPNLTWQQFMGSLPGQINAYKAPGVQAAVQQNGAPPVPPVAASPASATGTGTGNTGTMQGAQAVRMPQPAATAGGFGNAGGLPQQATQTADTQAPWQYAQQPQQPVGTPMAGVPPLPQPQGQQVGLPGQTSQPGITQVNPQNDVADTLYRASTRYMDPQFQTREAALENKLINQGLRPGTEAFTTAMRDFNADRSNAYADARDRAILASGAEQSRQFGLGAQQFGQGMAVGEQQFGQGAQRYNMGLAGGAQDWGQRAQQFQLGLGAQGQQYGQQAQTYQLSAAERQRALQEQAFLRSIPLNEMNALRTGAPVNIPQFQPFATQGVQPAPIFQGAQAQGQADQNRYNAEQAQQGQFLGGLMSLGGTMFGGGVPPWLFR